MKLRNKQSVWIPLGIIVFIILLYFFPILKGKVIFQYDVVSSKAASKSLMEYKEKFGVMPLWNPRMFSGMPTIYLANETPGNFVAKTIHKTLSLIPYPVNYALVGSIGFFVMLLTLGIRPWLALGFSLGFTFFSYNVQIVEAGHTNKFMSIMAFPWMLAGLFLLFERKEILWGTILSLFGIILELYTNHIQIIYYNILISAIIFVYYFVKFLKNKDFPYFGKASALLIIILLASVMAQANRYIPLRAYAKYSIRGPSELVRDKDTASGKGGLDMDYAYRWSLGKGEALTLIAPNAAGGPSTSALGEESQSFQWLQQNRVPNAYQIIQRFPTYWQEQPFTSGGIYVGIVIMTLLVTALFFEVPLMYPLLIIALLGLNLSLGKHAISILSSLFIIALPLLHSYLKTKLKIESYKLGTGFFLLGLGVFIFDSGGGYRLIDFFFEYLPLYNKFRVPSTQLVMVSLSAPIIAALGTEQFLRKKDFDFLKPRLIYASTIVLGFLLFFYLFGTEFFSFSGPNDSRYGFPQGLLDALKQDRMEMYNKDFLRSIFLAAITLAFLWLAAKELLKNKNIIAGALSALIIFDNVSVARRFLNSENFVEPQETETPLQPRPYEQFIMQDTTYYRIFPLSEDPFNDGHTVYYLNSVGGYSPAKLKRYQQLIETHLGKGVPNVMNMLNTKYIVTQDSLPFPFLQLVYKTPDRKFVYLNRAAFGPAWITSQVITVKIPDQALDTLDKVNSYFTAIIEEKDKKHLTSFDTSRPDSNEYIKLIYHDNLKLIYEFNSPKTRFVTFSEIYYPGWNLYIDGKPAHVFQTNFVLRGAIIPAGKHKLEFRFEPDFIQTAATVSYIGSALWILLFAISAFFLWKKYKKNPSQENNNLS